MSIREINKDDESALRTFFSSLNHETLMSYGRFDEATREKEVQRLIDSIRDGSELGWGFFENQKILGYHHYNLSEKFSRKNHQASLGIVIHQDRQGRGIGRQLLAYGLRKMKEAGFRKIWLHTWSDNHAGLALYLRLGFIQEGYFQRDQVIDGELKDVVSMAKFL